MEFLYIVKILTIIMFAIGLADYALTSIRLFQLFTGNGGYQLRVFFVSVLWIVSIFLSIILF